MKLAILDDYRRMAPGWPHAALDVHDREPLPADHPLRAMENVTLCPHLGYVSEDIYAVFYGDTLENIEAWLDGKPVRVINREALA